MKRLSHNRHNKFGLLLVVTLLIGGLSSCSTVPGKNGQEKDESSQPVPDMQKEIVKGDDIAAAGMDDDLLFNLLAGEFAGVRGQMQQSIRYYAKAAEISEDPQIISRAAYIALYASDYELAIELTDRWLSLKLAENKTIDRIRALAYLHLQQLEPSVVMIEKSLLLDGKIYSQSVASMTHLLTKEATPQFALQVIERLNQKHPDEPVFLLLMAKFEANLGKFDQALLHTDQLLKIDSKLTDVYLIKAQILASNGQHQEAMQSIATAVETRPQDRHLRLQYARMLVQLKEFDAASEQFLILKKAMPNDENVLLSLGLLSIETANYNQGKKYLQALLDNGYHNQQAYYYLGRIQQSQGENMAAIANYERVYSGEYLLDARIRSASLIASSGKTEEALTRLESLNLKDHTEPNQIRLYLAKGQVLNAASRNDEAYRLYNNALQHSPENTELLYARALTAEKLDLLDVTESDLKMVIMQEPENASALNALGYTLADRTERLNEAREYILKAAKLLPEDPAILDSLGWVYYRLGQHENAIKWLSKAFEALQDAEIAAHLGEVLWVDGQTDKARSIWRKGKNLDGNQTLLQNTMQRLKTD